MDWVGIRRRGAHGIGLRSLPSVGGPVDDILRRNSSAMLPVGLTGAEFHMKVTLGRLLFDSPVTSAKEGSASVSAVGAAGVLKVL